MSRPTATAPRVIPSRTPIPFAEISEAELVERCRRSDREAIQTALLLHIDVLRRVLVRLLGPHADTEDALQDTLMAAAASFPNYQGKSRLSTWLIGIAVRIAKRHRSRPYRWRRIILQALPQEDAPAAQTPVDEVAQARTLLDKLYIHIDALSEKQRTAFLLHAVGGQSAEQIAQAIGIGRHTVKTRILLARRSLVAKAKKDPALRELLAEFEQGSKRGSQP